MNTEIRKITKIIIPCNCKRITKRYAMTRLYNTKSVINIDTACCINDVEGRRFLR